jgi:hypothetical protein
VREVISAGLQRIMKIEDRISWRHYGYCGHIDMSGLMKSVVAFARDSRKATQVFRVLRHRHAVVAAVGIEERAICGQQPVSMAETIACRAPRIDMPVESDPVGKLQHPREVLFEKMGLPLKRKSGNRPVRGHQNACRK